MPIFLFTDIEGSTIRWETRPAEMSEAVAQHDRILRSAVEAHRGRVFKTVGDAFCAVFDRFPDAVGAAVAAQRSLSAAEWSAVEGLHVRMALHGGDAIERDGDFFGPAVNRVARLLSTAHGGQIVVSGTLADAAAPENNGIALLPLGTFRLKDLERPERIYQVTAAGLAETFKPLVTLDAIPNNLPVQGSSFVGRAEDIVKTRSLLRETRLLTIAGPGGVGKTRMALACAADRMDRMTDGVWFVNLAPLSDSSLVATTMVSAIGAVAPDDRDALTALAEHLRNKTMLIVLDNCEHLVDEAARCVTSIHERCPHVTIVATSREALHVAGEQVYRLNPLQAQDAVALFAARAQSVLPGFTLTAENRGFVEAICTRLDGIPLAIELAAARVHALSPQQIAERLDRRFRLLSAGTRTALPRQQTLQALIDWSHDLLTDTEKILFRRLSVFRGSFMLESASAVCAGDLLDEWTIVDLLTSLADKSLVVADVDAERPRYHLLESIREYAWTKLQTEGEGTQLQLCHAEFFAQLASKAYREFDTSPPPNWLSDLAPDLDNFRAALERSLGNEPTRGLGTQLAADTGPMFLRMSLLNEGIAWCRRAESFQSKTAPETAARLQYVLSMLYTNQGAYPQALEAVRRARQFFESGNDPRGKIRAFSQHAHHLALAGRFEDAQALCEQAIALAGEIGDCLLTASVLRRCAFALPPSQIEVAREQFQRALGELEGAADTRERCRTLEWWAEREAAAGFNSRAIELATAAIECADADSRMYLSSNIAGYYLAEGAFEAAKPFVSEAGMRAIRAKHPLMTLIAIEYGSALLLTRDPQNAARVYGYAKNALSKLEWKGIASDVAAQQNIERSIIRSTGAGAFCELTSEGANWREGDALARLDVFSSDERPSFAEQRS